MVDPVLLQELAKQALVYMSPLIAQGVLTKIGEHTGDAAKDLASKTWGLLERAFKGHDEAEAALTLYKVKPEDEGRQKIVEGEIVARFGQDEAARNELAELVRQAREPNLLPQQVAQQIHNQVIRDNAQVGTAVAGNVYGGIRTGPQRRIDTGGGDYAERDIDRRRGTFVDGGTIYGPVGGSTNGGITYDIERDKPDGR